MTGPALSNKTAYITYLRRVRPNSFVDKWISRLKNKRRSDWLTAIDKLCLHFAHFYQPNESREEIFGVFAIWQA